MACTGGCVSCKEVGQAGPVQPGRRRQPRSARQVPGSGARRPAARPACATAPAAAPPTRSAPSASPASCSGRQLDPGQRLQRPGHLRPGHQPVLRPVRLRPRTPAGDRAWTTASAWRPPPARAAAAGPRAWASPAPRPASAPPASASTASAARAACEGKCSFCALPNAPGRCQNAPLGSLDPRAAAGVTDPNRICADEGLASCGQNGRCDGEGGCQRYPDGTMCTPETCDPATHRYSVGLCQAGLLPGQRPRLRPLRLQRQHLRPALRQQRRLRQPARLPGQLLRQDPRRRHLLGQQPGRVRQSGICAQGVCCKTSCGGSCQTCAMAPPRAPAAPVQDGGIDPAGVCVDMKPAACSTDGRCDGTGALPDVRPGQPVRAPQLHQRPGPQGLVLHRRPHLPGARGRDLHPDHRLQRRRHRLRAHLHPGQPVPGRAEVPVGPVWPAGDRPVVQRQDRLPIRVLRRRRLLQRGLRRQPAPTTVRPAAAGRAPPPTAPAPPATA